MSTESICLSQLVLSLERLAVELRLTPVSLPVVRTLLGRVDAMRAGAGVAADTLEPLLAPLRTGDFDALTGVTPERLRMLARSLRQRERMGALV